MNVNVHIIYYFTLNVNADIMYLLYEGHLHVHVLCQKLQFYLSMNKN